MGQRNCLDFCDVFLCRKPNRVDGECRHPMRKEDDYGGLLVERSVSLMGDIGSPPVSEGTARTALVCRTILPFSCLDLWVYIKSESVYSSSHI